MGFGSAQFALCSVNVWLETTPCVFWLKDRAASSVRASTVACNIAGGQDSLVRLPRVSMATKADVRELLQEQCDVKPLRVVHFCKECHAGTQSGVSGLFPRGMGDGTRTVLCARSLMEPGGSVTVNRQGPADPPGATHVAAQTIDGGQLDDDVGKKSLDMPDGVERRRPTGRLCVHVRMCVYVYVYIDVCVVSQVSRGHGHRPTFAADVCL